MLERKNSWLSRGALVYDVRLWFKEPKELYYKLMIVKQGDYFLLLEDGNSKVKPEGFSLQP